jgi:hypothetical protein
MLEVGQKRIWNQDGAGVFTIMGVFDDGTANYNYAHSLTLWGDRIEYILINSAELSPVLKELYE